MAVTYQGSDQWGPNFPAVAGGSSGIPLTSAEPTQPATPEGTPLNTDDPVTGRSQMAIQKWFHTQ